MREPATRSAVALLVCASLWAPLLGLSSEAQEQQTPQEAEEGEASSGSSEVPPVRRALERGGRLSGDAEPKESYYRYRGLERGLGPWFEMKDRLADKRGAYGRPAEPGLRGRTRDLPKRELLRHRPYRLAESPPRSS